MVARVIAESVSRVEDSLHRSRNDLPAIDEERDMHAGVAIEHIEQTYRVRRRSVVEGEEQGRLRTIRVGNMPALIEERQRLDGFDLEIGMSRVADLPTTVRCR